MRKRMMRLFCLILAAVLLMPLVYDDAHATAFSWTFNQYEWQYYMIHSGYYEAAASVTVTEGVVPQGMSVLIDEDQSAVFAGSATSYGNFYFVVRVDCLSGDWYSYEVNALVQQQIIDAYTPPSVTKNPTSETTSVGGSVTFISRATDTDACVWYITNGSDTYECQYAPHVLDGIRVSGQGTERLTLSNVPAQINGWSVYCAFSGAGGETLSKAATITVRADEAVPSDAAPSTSSQTPGEVQPPRITRQPEGLALAAGKTGTLRVEAEAPPGAKVYYQWYCVTDGDGWEQMVSGGTGPALTVRAEKENVDYFVTVWYEAENGVSAMATSRRAVVKLEQDAQTQVTEEPTNSAALTTPPPPKKDTSEKAKSPILWIVLAGIVVLLGAGAIVLVLCVNKKKKPVPRPRPVGNETLQQAQPSVSGRTKDEWFCSECGTKNGGKFCRACGAKRREEMTVRCANCGWESDDPEKPPRFCPNCGAPL